MARKEGLRVGGEPGIARSASAVIAAENASLVDANYPVAQALDCSGFDTILVGCEITGGAAPTMTIEALVRDNPSEDNSVADGARWKRMLLGAKEGITAIASPVAEDTGALDGASFVELRVFGAKRVMLRIKAVTNAAGTTAWKILAVGGKTRNVASINRA